MLTVETRPTANEPPSLAPQISPSEPEPTVKTGEILAGDGPALDAPAIDRAAATPSAEARAETAPAPPEAPREEASGELAADGPAAPPENDFLRPTALIEKFEELAADRRTGHWANECLEAIAAVWLTPPQPATTRDPNVLKLRRLAGRDASVNGNPQLSTRVARARYALIRWLDLRESVAELDAVPTVRTSNSATKQVAACLSAIDKLSMQGISGGEWRDFLLVDRLRLLTSEVASPEARRAAARRVLDRLDSPRLTRQQRKFIAEPPITNLRAALAAWAAEPVAPKRVLADVERYERSGLPSDAQRAWPTIFAACAGRTSPRRSARANCSTRVIATRICGSRCRRRS